MKKISKEWLIIAGYALIKLFIHLLTNTNYELHRDAFLYYSNGEHLDWGYLSIPPLIAVFSKISVFLFGNTVFALRFFPAIIGTLSVIIIAKTIKELNGGTWALIIGLTAYILSPSFLRSNTLFQPVSFNQFFWLLSAYLILKLIKTNNPKWWIAIFAVFGFAFLNKYSITFFILAFLLSMAFTEHRKLYLSKFFFLGGILSILIILPNIIWQHQHNWPVIAHMSELQETQLVNVSITGFFIGQLLMNLPGLIIWITGLITFLFFKSEKKYRLLAFIYLFTVLMIILLRGKAYYTLGLYPTLFALGGYAVDKYFNPLMKYATIALLLLLITPLLPLSLPLYSHERLEAYTKNIAEFTNKWEDGKVHNLPQDYADMIGWEELADMVIATYKNLPVESQKRCTIFAGEYCTAGAILFYGKEHELPEPICFEDNFLLWAPDSINTQTTIYINKELGDMEWLFENNKLVGKINNKYFRENGTSVYLCTQPRDTLTTFYAGIVADLKTKFRKH